jgi:hypothetical protein
MACNDRFCLKRFSVGKQSPPWPRGFRVLDGHRAYTTLRPVNAALQRAVTIIETKTYVKRSVVISKYPKYPG